jgi:hypothetical protein
LSTLDEEEAVAVGVATTSSVWIVGIDSSIIVAGDFKLMAGRERLIMAVKLI